MVESIQAIERDKSEEVELAWEPFLLDDLHRWRAGSSSEQNVNVNRHERRLEETREELLALNRGRICISVAAGLTVKEAIGDKRIEDDNRDSLIVRWRRHRPL
jgi:hypothetical protein